MENIEKHVWSVHFSKYVSFFLQYSSRIASFEDPGDKFLYNLVISVGTQKQALRRLFVENVNFGVAFQCTLDTLGASLAWSATQCGQTNNFCHFCIIFEPMSDRFCINFGTFLDPSKQIQWVAGAHQMQLELMVNYGLVGAVLYWSIWISFMRRLFLAVNSTMAITRFLSVGLLAYFILPSYVANLMIQEHSVLPWLLLGLTMALYQKFK